MAENGKTVRTLMIVAAIVVVALLLFNTLNIGLGVVSGITSLLQGVVNILGGIWSAFGAFVGRIIPGG